MTNPQPAPPFDGWTAEEIEHYFSVLDDEQLVPLLRARLTSPDYEVQPLEELAQKFGITLDL